MRFDRFTIKAQEALENSTKFGNGFAEPRT